MMEEEVPMVSESSSFQANDDDSSSGVKSVTSLFAQTNIHTVPSFRLHETSPEERTEALQDLHGASDVIEESPEFVREKLVALDLELFLFDNMETREACDEAVCQNEGYVRNLRLAFLRAEKFNVAKAARRMMAHFTKRRELFQDPELLGRDIRLSDLQNNESDVQGLRTGKFQLLTHCDRAGRPIMFLYPAAGASKAVHPVDSWERIVMWLSILAANSGEEVEKKGFVVIWYGLGMPYGPAHTYYGPRCFESLQIMPIGLRSVHICFDNPGFTEVMEEIARESNSKSVFRMRSHCGGHIECQTSLATYGIPRLILPVQPNGSIKLQEHERFLNRIIEDQNRQQRLLDPSDNSENMSDTSSLAQSVPEIKNEERTPRLVASPGPMDVILGRGQRGYKSPGNVLLRRLLQENYEEYNACSRAQKPVISQRIYRRMKEEGCRFLAPHENGENEKAIVKTSVDRSYCPEAWAEVDEKAARDRISHGFRNMRHTKN